MEIKEYLQTAIKMFKFRLPVTKCKKYVAWLKGTDLKKEFHHVVGRKTTDYLGVMLTRTEHRQRHDHPTMYFVEDLLQAVNNLISHVRYLEDETK